MNKLIRLRQTDAQKVYWASDTHFNHDPKWPVPLWEARGHKSSKDHTNFMINKINEIVRPNDILMHAGDFCLNTDESKLNELLARIQCQNIYMVWGNHNNPLWKIYQTEVKSWFCSNDEGYNGANGGTPYVFDDSIIPEIYPFRYKNVVFLGNYAEIVVDGQYFVLCHFPIYVWNSLQDGAKMICGHSHYGLPFSQEENLDAKILDVGWDGYARPLSTEEVLSIMNKKAIFKPGDHHANNEPTTSNHCLEKAFSSVKKQQKDNVGWSKNHSSVIL